MPKNDKSSKSESKEVAPIVTSYSFIRKDSGYQAIKMEIQDEKVVSVSPCFEPDVLSICMAKFTQIVRKDLGL